jgi:hypothetical protein
MVSAMRHGADLFSFQRRSSSRGLSSSYGRPREAFPSGPGDIQQVLEHAMLQTFCPRGGIEETQCSCYPFAVELGTFLSKRGPQLTARDIPGWFGELYSMKQASVQVSIGVNDFYWRHLIPKNTVRPRFGSVPRNKSQNKNTKPSIDEFNWACEDGKSRCISKADGRAKVL